MNKKIRWWGLLLVLAGGCGSPQAKPPVPPPLPVSSPSTVVFDPSTAVTLQGHVTWKGIIPVVPPFNTGFPPVPAEIAKAKPLRENPNAPVIDPKTKGVGKVVIFLRGVDRMRARPWDHPPVRVELRNLKIHVFQGCEDSNVGFIRRGDSVEMVSAEPLFHSLHGRGDSFFTVPFPDANRVSSRALNNKGVVELMSAAGYYWMRAYLFVDDHPYYTRTNTQGEFVLDKVPPGQYDLVAWMPNWNKVLQERDPEIGFITRIFFDKPKECVQPLLVKQGEEQHVNFVFSREMFQPDVNH